MMKILLCLLCVCALSGCASSLSKPPMPDGSHRIPVNQKAETTAQR